MTKYEKQNLTETEEKNEIEEIDPDYVTGGAKVVPPESTEGLSPKPHIQKCDCGEFSPNKAGTCGAPICENCIHAKKTSSDSTTTFCEKQFITIS